MTDVSTQSSVRRGKNVRIGVASVSQSSKCKRLVFSLCHRARRSQHRVLGPQRHILQRGGQTGQAKAVNGWLLSSCIPRPVLCSVGQCAGLPGAAEGCCSCLVNLCIPQTFEQTVKWLCARFLAPGFALQNMHLWQCGTFHVFLTFGESGVWIFSCIASIYQLCDSGSPSTRQTLYLWMTLALYQVLSSHMSSESLVPCCVVNNRCSLNVLLLV